MSNRKFAAIAMMAACLPAYANPPAAPVQPTAQQAAPAQKTSREAAEIAAINERLAVMTARLAELEMQAKIAIKQSEISKVSSSSSMDESFIPSVQEISGIDGRVWAVLNVQGGNTQTVRVGDKFGAWRVMDIKADSVTVQKNNETLRLSFGNSTPQPPQLGSLPPPPYPAR